MARFDKVSYIVVRELLPDIVTLNHLPSVREEI